MRRGLLAVWVAGVLMSQVSFVVAEELAKPTGESIV